MNHFWSGTFADWLVGGGTLLLALFAFVQILRDRAQRKRDRKENRELQDALKAERQKADDAAAAAVVAEVERERRSQAKKVVVWDQPTVDESDPRIQDDGNIRMMGGGGPAAIVRNSSNRPVTNVEIHWVNAEGGGELGFAIIPTIPPRADVGAWRPTPLARLSIFALELVFRDANGVLWKRTRDGKLGEIG